MAWKLETFTYPYTHEFDGIHNINHLNIKTWELMVFKVNWYRLNWITIFIIPRIVYDFVVSPCDTIYRNISYALTLSWSMDLFDSQILINPMKSKSRWCVIIRHCQSHLIFLHKVNGNANKNTNKCCNKHSKKTRRKCVGAIKWKQIDQFHGMDVSWSFGI